MYWRGAGVALMALAIGIPAPAQFQELAPGDFRCEASAGNYFNQPIPALQPGKPVTVRIRLLTEHPDPAWLEQSGVYFETPTGRMRVLVGKADNDPQHIYVDLQNDGTGEAEIVDQYPVTNDWITLTLKLGHNGVVRVESRGHKAKLDLGTTLQIPTEVHCHSGIFEIQVVPAQG